MSADFYIRDDDWTWEAIPQTPKAQEWSGNRATRLYGGFVNYRMRETIIRELAEAGMTFEGDIPHD